MSQFSPKCVLITFFGEILSKISTNYKKWKSGVVIIIVLSPFSFLLTVDTVSSEDLFKTKKSFDDYYAQNESSDM